MSTITDFSGSDFPSVATLTADAAACSEDEFVERYPGYFLITEAIHQDDGAWRYFQTSTVPAIRPGQQRAALAVSPVAKRDQTNPYSWMITIGRTKNNDVVLSDVSISKLHAWIRRRDDDGGAFAFTITDAGSRNGTFVNGDALRGETGPLPVGARVRLGQVELIFVDSVALYRAMRGSRRGVVSAA